MADFNCDRQAKNDFTASTLAICSQNRSFSAVEFFEKDEEGNLVEYGDPSASEKSHYDIFMNYITSAWSMWYVFELKERHNNSDKYETAFINEEKWKEFIDYKESGITPMWCELYEDGVIRIWNLWDVDFSRLPISRRLIKKINIDPNSPKEWQYRREIPMYKGKTYRRKKG